MLRYRADIQTLIYISGLTALTLYLLTGELPHHSTLNSVLWALQLIAFVSAGVMVHNHKHVPIWKNKVLNTITDCWLTLLYGYPVFGWIPTHLQNHHLHTNKEDDYTKTYAYSENNNLLTILYYPMYSGGVQQKAIGDYLKKLYKKDRGRFWAHMLQVVTLIGLILMVFAFDWKKALVYIVLPHQVALNSVLFFNYIQHIHADENSQYNHSRNVTGWALNFLLFNNGLHTVHHLKPHLHWSKLRAFHNEIKGRIDPQLNEKSLLGYLFKQYLFSPFVPGLATISLRKNSSKCNKDVEVEA